MMFLTLNHLAALQEVKKVIAQFQYSSYKVQRNLECMKKYLIPVLISAMLLLEFNFSKLQEILKLLLKFITRPKIFYQMHQKFAFQECIALAFRFILILLWLQYYFKITELNLFLYLGFLNLSE